jgi:hypothetical protein
VFARIISFTTLFIALAVLGYPCCISAADHDLLEVRAVYEFDNGGDGTIDSVILTTNQYNPHGDLTETLHAYYSSTGDLDYTDITTYTYDKHHQRLFAEQRISLSPAWRAVITYTNLARNVTEQIKAVDWDGNGTVDYTEKTTTTLNPDGSAASTVRELFGFAADQRAVTTWTYDYQHHRYVIHASIYYNNVLRGIFQTVVSLDHRRRPISSLQDVDEDADGTTDWSITADYVYDKLGDVVHETSIDWVGLPGGAIRSKVTATFYYARNRRLKLSDEP